MDESRPAPSSTGSELITPNLMRSLRSAFMLSTRKHKRAFPVPPYRSTCFVGTSSSSTPSTLNLATRPRFKPQPQNVLVENSCALQVRDVIEDAIELEGHGCSL